MKEKNNNNTEALLKCAFCDRESYQAGRFITNNMNFITVLCKEHLHNLIDAQRGIDLDYFNELRESAGGVSDE